MMCIRLQTRDDVGARQKLLLTVPYFPPHLGGAELFAFNIAEQLTCHYGWEVAVVTTGTGARAELEERSPFFRVYRLPYRWKLSNTPLSIAWLWQVKAIINDEDPDLVNIHTPVPGLGDVASLLSGKRPVVVNYHAGSMRKQQGSYLNSLIWFYERLLAQPMLRRASRIISSSDYVRDAMLGRFTAKALTINPAVDSDMFHPADIAGNSPNANVLFVGSLKISDGHKNLPALFTACQRLRDSFSDLKLTIVGDGDSRKRYEDLALSMGLGDITTFTGWLDRTSLSRAYREAAVFALPSTDDSFPLVITEAMASGVPVVSTRVGGIPTLVEDGVDGLLVPVRDNNALLEALRRVLEDRDLARKLSQAGREKAVSKLSWSSRGELTDQVFRDVLARAGASRLHSA